MQDIKDLKYISNYVILKNENEIAFIININEVPDLDKMDSFLSNTNRDKLYLKGKNIYLELLDLTEDEIFNIKLQKILSIAITNEDGDVLDVKEIKNIKK